MEKTLKWLFLIWTNCSKKKYMSHPAQVFVPQSCAKQRWNTFHCEDDFKILFHLINDEIFLHLINAKLEPQLVHIVGQSWDPTWKSIRICQQLAVRRSGFSGYFRKSQSQTCVMTLSNRVSHFYTFFELSLVLLTTHAHGLQEFTKKNSALQTKN